MNELDMDDYRRDAEYDATQDDYEVTVTVQFTYKTHARSQDEARNEAYDEIDSALRGSYLDYEFAELVAEEVG